ncbi:50S ribosomal protein L18e [uncultured archaeon]|nr:50S ribosomal protein L18e [uncultured archaeon]
MKRTVNSDTRGLGIMLGRLATKSKKGVWADLAEKVTAPVRKKAEINVYRLSVVAAANKGKILVVPGKVLSAGESAKGIEVACLSCSKAARDKITKAGGKVMGIMELIESKASASKVVIVQ